MSSNFGCWGTISTRPFLLSITLRKRLHKWAEPDLFSLKYLFDILFQKKNKRKSKFKNQNNFACHLHWLFLPLIERVAFVIVKAFSSLSLSLSLPLPLPLSLSLLFYLFLFFDQKSQSSNACNGKESRVWSNRNGEM